MTERILIIDSDAARAEQRVRTIAATGIQDIRTVHDARRVLPTVREFQPDVLLLELHMPHLDGTVLLQQIFSRMPEPHALPVLVTSGDVDAATRKRALELGATDFLPNGADAAELSLRLANLIRLRNLHARLEDRVRDRTAQLEVAEVEIAKRLAFAAELRDYPDGAHPTRVGRFSAAIARELGLPADEVEMIRLAAPLHDIGKLGMPDSILLKPGALTDEELDVMRSHTTLGAKMLTGTVSGILQAAEEIALYHHENFDGTGYTPGLAGDDIPISGRIVTIADVFDALLHRRSYKPAWAVDDALSFINTQRGRKFDPKIVDAFNSVVQQEHGRSQVDEWGDFMSTISETFSSTFSRAMAD